MPITEKVTYVHEPTWLQCGQAVIAMLGNLSVSEVIKIVGTERETTLKQMLSALDTLKIRYSLERKTATSKDNLPPICILSLETPKCWHWSLYFEGVFYDPEYGILDDFPPSNRRYYFEILKEPTV